LRATPGYSPPGSSASPALVLWIGGRDVLAGRISAGDLSAFVFYAVVVAMAVGTLSEVWGDVQRAAGAAADVAGRSNTRQDGLAAQVFVMGGDRE
jgi:ATP-binding cassette, subfamily B, bacterial